MLSACVTGKEADDPDFTRADGTPGLDFHDAWHAVCVRSGVGKFICLDCDQVVPKTKCNCGSRRRKYIRSAIP